MRDLFLFTKFYESIKTKRSQFYEQVEEVFVMFKRDDVSPISKHYFMKFYNNIDQSLMLKPKSHIIHWITMSRRIESHQVELSELVTKGIADIHEINIAKRAIPGLIELVPNRLKSMEWISEPLIVNTTAHTYMRLATDNFVKAMELYAKFEKYQLPIIQDFLEESVHYMDKADKICPDSERYQN